MYLLLMKKAQHGGNLVPKRIQVTRNGKTFTQTVWVKSTVAGAARADTNNTVGINAKRQNSNMQTDEVKEAKRQYDEIVNRYTNADGTRKSGWMKAPNGKPTNLNERQWVQSRTPLFKRWFGDWEKTKNIENFNKSKIIKVNTVGIKPDADLKQFKKNAFEYGKKITGKYTNKSDGLVFNLTTSSRLGGLKEILEHDYKDPWHLKSIAAIPQIAQEATFITERANEDAQKHPEIKSFRYYLSKVEIDNTPYVVKSIVSIAKDGSRYYDHKLTVLAALSVIQKTDKATSTDIKDIRLLQILQDNRSEVSKVVDENGEPMVLYHGTEENFDTFDKEKSKVKQAAFYFTPHEKAAGMYRGLEKSGNILPVFLNIKKPYIFQKDSDSHSISQDKLEQLTKEGYDGGIYKSADRKFWMFDEITVFSPNQIKSATDNTGTFITNNGNIKKSQHRKIFLAARRGKAWALGYKKIHL